MGISGVSSVRYLNRYDIDHVSAAVAQRAASRIFSEPQGDFFTFRQLELDESEQVIIWEYLPGQYDQRSDSAQQCLSLLQAGLGNGTGSGAPQVRCARMVILRGEVSLSDLERIQGYLINPVDSRLASADLPASLDMTASEPEDIPVMKGFTDMEEPALLEFHQELGLAMDMADLAFLQSYFRNAGRNPTETEIRVLDTYWSDHCRHTTFNTVLEEVAIEDGPFAQRFRQSLENYTEMRAELYVGRDDKPVTLMDMAVIGAKYLKEHGKLDDIELSAEINACSIYIDVNYTHPEPRTERWLLMFKNETHNHPTEIEPFGGAATCIGGAIRDPLSGRSWVYQSLRVTGAADPTVPVERTREGKLPQMKLTREAAAGFSSYGNQIGLATGQVAEIYHPGFEAKRMELGAVIAAAPAEMVRREEPECGDVVVLVGGGTGRDGIGGATGSSKIHTVESVTEAAAEVQKGNAVEERKIQRLFRNPAVSRLIRRCNDFGAGGVAVAVGELAPGLDIDLDAVPKKYEGLNGTELAISESQERMALVVRAGDVDELMAACAAENLNAAVIARVTGTNRLVMKWRGQTIVDIDRDFLDTAGATRSASALVRSPKVEGSPLLRPLHSVVEAFFPGKGEGADSSLQHTGSLVQTARSWLVRAVENAWRKLLADLACCGQRGLSERFDGSIGAGTVLFPLGGRYQATPEAGMAAKIPVLDGETSTVSLMAYGYDPRIAQWSPWHGGQIAVLSSLAKIAAMGGNPASCRLSFQEYFERMEDADSWGKPAAALLGALEAQRICGTAAIGGKDSMSGSFQELKVPPTLVSFAVATESQERVRGGSFVAANHSVYLVSVPYGAALDPNLSVFMQNMAALYQLGSKVVAAYPVGAGGVAEAVAKMAFGNRIGLAMRGRVPVAGLPLDSCFQGFLPAGVEGLFLPAYGSLVVEVADGVAEADFMEAGFAEDTVRLLGSTISDPVITVVIPDSGAVALKLADLESCWEKTLAQVFPQISSAQPAELPGFAAAMHESLQQIRQKAGRASLSSSSINVLKEATPRVLLPVFPGTNCEFDMRRAFQLAGGDVRVLVFRNNSPAALSESLAELAAKIDQAQILAFSGGFSAGDEPDGSGKFIANVIREPQIAQAIMDLLENRDGLILGICNGFQALIKTGLVPYGRILEPSAEMPTLTYNTVGRHISRISRTRLVSGLSPWAYHQSVLDEVIHLVPISHGEGRIVISEGLARDLFRKGQVFTQYVDEYGAVATSEPDNPNGSAYAIEGLTSPDGRILGKMGHSERTVGPDLLNSSPHLMKNVVGHGGGCKKMSACQNIFAAGVSYFL